MPPIIPKHKKSRNTPHARALAIQQRQQSTDSGDVLWNHLKKGRLGGYKFRREQPIGRYVADFACMSEKLVVELDGSQHADQIEHDSERDKYISKSGFRVLRFWSDQIFRDKAAVLEKIHSTLQNKR